MAKSAAAVFLDRDGTVIADPGYLRDCAQVRLLGGVVEALRRFGEAGFRLVIVTNQSGIARGYLTEIELAAVHTHLRRMLEAQGVRLDGMYYCPYHPEGAVEAYRKDSDWRKPQCGMLKAAASDLGLDLCASWMIGDSLRDVEAGKRAGCRTVLLADGGKCTPKHAALGVAPAADFVVGDLLAASRRILAVCSCMR